MHLVSRCRFPSLQMLPTETVVDYLMSAPRMVREVHPMHWTFLDGPPDGTVMLTWQPLHQLGVNFASDGYVWADAEQAFTFESRGYVGCLHDRARCLLTFNRPWRCGFTAVAIILQMRQLPLTAADAIAYLLLKLRASRSRTLRCGLSTTHELHPPITSPPSESLFCRRYRLC